MRKLAIFGSTGSIGKQALEVVRLHQDKFKVTALSAHKNASLLFEQVKEFRPLCACLSGDVLKDVPQELSFCTFYDQKDFEKMASETDAEDALVSIVGVAGLKITMALRKSNKRILLANKETLVSGGELVMEACKKEKGEYTLLPVDSEHSAIFQCLQGAQNNKVSKIYLTASGGPFRTWDKEKILSATKQQALLHPTWQMGQKITIDSASMFNKALEIIEAKWLFDVAPKQIEVVVHKESIVHSMVGFEDGAVIAQMGLPDMKVPILYAMNYPNRLNTGVSLPDFSKISSLSFEKGDEEKFPSLKMAYQALEAKGASCCILNAANEVAVDAFLKEQIPFGGIYKIVDNTLNEMGYHAIPSVEDVLYYDQLAREKALDYIRKHLI